MVVVMYIWWLLQTRVVYCWQVSLW